MKKALILVAAAIPVAAACKKKESKPATTAETKTDAGGGATASGALDAGAADTPDKPVEDAISVPGFDTPESVLHDATDDVYLVSNIVAGKPSDKDDNGFISRVQPDGKVDLKWIDGGKPDITLHAPKGMAIVDDTLYVTDIDVVRMFDRKSGAVKGEIAVDGATFLNDLAAIDGVLWLTDTGVKISDKGIEETGTDAIYRIDADNKVTKVMGGADLGHPNGVAGISDTEVRVVTFGSGEIYKVTVVGDEGGITGEKSEVTKIAGGQLDGVVEMPDSSLLVSSWEKQTVYRVDEDGKATEVVTGVESPADIGLDASRRRVLIPLFNKNTVEIRALK